ncbi:MAG: radical SAM protein [Desulfuromonadales bacterium]|nr:radical SAM protein [Desulfuromonadales bacterium]
MNRVTVPFFISHQGCPNACIFCDQRAITGSAGDVPFSSEISAKIRAWQRFSGDRPLEVAFFGGTFTALSRPLQQQLLSSVHPFLASGEVSAIRISTRPDSLDADTVQWLAGQGVKTIEIGVQSMDDGVLAASGRGHDAAATLRALHSITSHGLAAGAQLMPGLPGDSPAISRYSLESVISAGADFIRIYPVVVLRDTELARHYLSGRYRPLSVDEGVALCKVLVHVSLKREIPVIRIGLQDDEGLRNKSVLAGCWHPALGELVYGELFYDLLLQMLDPVPITTQPITISCHPARVSNVIGHKKRNIRRLSEQEVTVARVVTNPSLSPFECEIRSSVCHRKGSIMSDLQYA